MDDIVNNVCIKLRAVPIPAMRKRKQIAELSAGPEVAMDVGELIVVIQSPADIVVPVKIVSPDHGIEHPG